jgi:hypothetical protein
MNEIIRSLGFYQPFGSLMLHGKIETRWCREGRKPPFPKGKYLLYTTQKICDAATMEDWCGVELIKLIGKTLNGETTTRYRRRAIAIAELYDIKEMLPTQEKDCFVKFVGDEVRVDKNGIAHLYIQQCLYFKNIQRVQPFIFKGKQGVGILTDEQKEKIEVV